VADGVVKPPSVAGAERRAPTGKGGGFRSAPSGDPCSLMIDNVGSLFIGIELRDLPVLLPDRDTPPPETCVTVPVRALTHINPGSLSNTERRKREAAAGQGG